MPRRHRNAEARPCGPSWEELAALARRAGVKPPQRPRDEWNDELDEPAPSARHNPERKESKDE